MHVSDESEHDAEHATRNTIYGHEVGRVVLLDVDAERPIYEMVQKRHDANRRAQSPDTIQHEPEVLQQRNIKQLFAQMRHQVTLPGLRWRRVSGAHLAG